MDFGSILDDSFAYARHGVWGRWTRWLVLIVCLIIFPLILGYIVRIYRGEIPAPEPEEWEALFIDGLKLLLVHILYLLPVILLVILAFIPVVSTLAASGALSQDFGSMTQSQSDRWMSSHPEIFSALGIMLLLLLLAVIGTFIVMFFSFLGTVRFARARSIREAFNFPAIVAHIGRIGWINYILALIIIGIIGFLFSTITNFFSLIPVIGFIVKIIVMIALYPPFIMFSARFSACVYDSGDEILPQETGRQPGVNQ